MGITLLHLQQTTLQKVFFFSRIDAIEESFLFLEEPFSV